MQEILSHAPNLLQWIARRLDGLVQLGNHGLDSRDDRLSSRRGPSWT
jgi:hypothetical protein